MIQTIIKRDGRIVGFNEEKIMAAIRKAMLHTEKGEDEPLIRKITDRIACNGREQMSVEEIQDWVEMELMKSPRKEVAKKYIAYRDQRSIARKAKTREMFLDIINAKSNDITRENANMNADTPAGMMMKFASETTKPFVDDYLLSDEVRDAIRHGYIHIHDKDYYPTKSLTCVQHPLDKILKKGFCAGHGEARPAKRIETASILGCISMETAQNEMHGGQAIPAFDFYLAPYVRLSYIEEIKVIEKFMDADYSHLYEAPIDDYLYKELDGLTGEERIKQQAINCTVRRVHQSMEAFIHNMNAIHSRGGNQVVFSSINYGTDTSAEGRCIIREILISTYQGVGNGSTAIFPIQIWKKKRGVSYLPTDRNYDLYRYACKVTARRFFPNFVNLDAPFNRHELWRVGSENLKPDETIESVINQGTLGIGFIGLAECLVALTGKHHGEDAASQELGLRIITYMRDRANEFSERYHHNFSVLATPAEGLSGKFTAKDKKEFGIIKGITDREYYTNSNHVPVYFKCSPKHKAEIEAPYHELTRGGHIFYVEIDGDATHNPEAIMDIVDLMDKYDIGYGSVNHNRNRCMDCGYEDAQEALEVCPSCGSTHIDRLQRITGYLVGATDRWNHAKLAELHDRVVHK